MPFESCQGGKKECSSCSRSNKCERGGERPKSGETRLKTETGSYIRYFIRTRAERGTTARKASPKKKEG